MVEIHKIICKKELTYYGVIIFSKNKEYKYHTIALGYRVYDQDDVAYLFCLQDFKKWFFTTQEQRKLKLRKLNNLS